VNRISVLGAGSWGTALAVHYAASGKSVKLWARRPEFAAELEAERINRRYLANAPLPPSLEVTADLEAAMDSDLVLVVVPSHGFREVVRHYLEVHPKSRPARMISASKGVETETLARMSQVVAEEAATAGRQAQFAVLSGPSFAAELAVGAPTAAVIATAGGTKSA